jgi:serine/threonine protein kinase
VDGVNLRQALRSGNLTAAEALAIVPPICAALQYAHNQGVLHRDIKPENILLDADGRVKIADFGVAKLAGAPSVPGATLTATGAQLGTAAYMAPEQIERPQDVDHRADIFSLGVVFYELLTGELPLGRFPAPSETAGTDPRLDTIVFRTLEKQRERRFQTAAEVKSEVEHVTSDQPPPMPPVGAVAPVKGPTPVERKSSATIKIAAIVLSLIVLPAVLVGLMLFIPKAQAPAPWGGVTLAIIGIVPTAAFLLVLGLTWLFRRLKRAGVSTGVAAAIVALVLIIIPPAGCITLLVPPYLFARSKPPVQMAQLSRSSTELRKTPLNEDEIAAHWKVSGQHPMWITVEVLGARRQLQLRSDGMGRYAAEIDLKINRSSTGETARLQLELGNGEGKAAGEFSFLSPPDGWMNRVFDEVASDGLYGAGKTTLARIGSDLMTLTIISDAPPAAQNAVSFTLRDVSFYEDTGTFDLKIEYLEKIEGDAELYFKNEGIEGSTYPSSAIGRIADQSELRSRRTWRLPDGLNDAIRRDLKFRIESQYLNKTIQVPAGELWEFFQIRLPDGKTAHVTMGARSGNR